MTYTKIATINKTFERCQAENIGISKHLIRSLASSGQIPTIQAGKTKLVNYEILMEFLNGTIQPRQPEIAGQIRPIPEKIQSIR
jgi:hypothetical protein